MERNVGYRGEPQRVQTHIDQSIIVDWCQIGRHRGGKHRYALGGILGLILSVCYI